MPEPGETQSLTLDQLRSLYPQLRRFAAVVADSDMEPDDLVHDALVSALARTEVIDRPAGYLRTAVVRSVVDRRRRAARWRERLPRLISPTDHHDRYPSDDAVLDDLRPLDRAVLFLSIVEGRPHAEIGEMLGISEPAVRQRVARAKRRAREAGNRDVPATADTTIGKALS